MPALRSVILAGGLAALAQAFTAPTTASWGPLLTPDLTHPVTQGQTFEVTWDPQSHPTEGVTISLVLCHGPSTNCVTAPTAIIEGVPAAQKSYSWSVPCDLAAGTQATDTGYGMLIIVDGTGEFQYSTQFSVLASDKCGSSSSSTASSNSTSTAVSPGGWTSIAGPGQGGYNGTSMITTSATVISTSPITYATNSASVTSAVVQTTGYATASPSLPTASPSSFDGAGVKIQTGELFGLIAGAVAMLAL